MSHLPKGMNALTSFTQNYCYWPNMKRKLVMLECVKCTINSNQIKYLKVNKITTPKPYHEGSVVGPYPNPKTSKCVIIRSYHNGEKR